MTASPDETLTEIRRTLESWHAIRQGASFLEMEEAVEAELHQLRASLLAEQTAETMVRECPACRECGTRMEPRTQQDRHVVLGGDETVDLHRSYSICPAWGSGSPWMSGSACCPTAHSSHGCISTRCDWSCIDSVESLRLGYGAG